MATSNAWLSVMVKSCSTIVKPRNIVKCSWEDNFRSLVEKMDMPKETAINKIQISNNEKFIDPVHVVPESAPLSLCDQFKCMFVCIHTEGAEGAPVSTATPVNALQLLLEKAQEYSLPPKIVSPHGKELRKDQQLYNDIVGKAITICVHYSSIWWWVCIAYHRYII